MLSWHRIYLDGGARQYILVQIPEPLDPNNSDQKVAADFCQINGKPCNIAELTKERLRRSGDRYRKEMPLFAGDLGFRVFKLDSSNIHNWDPDQTDLIASLTAHENSIKSDRSEQDILFELLLKLGIPLTATTLRRNIASKVVYSVGNGVLFACLSSSISQNESEALAEGLIAWRKELAPAGETTVVFKDAAFQSDVIKTNLACIFNAARNSFHKITIITSQYI